MTADFVAAIESLLGAYPGVKLEDRHLARYWAVLQNFPIEDVRAGIEEAIRHYAAFVPSAGQLCGSVFDVRRRASQEKDRQVEIWDGDLDKLRPLYPDTDFEEREPPEGSPFTALAIEWRREDRERVPGYTPTDITKARLEKFFAMLDRAGASGVPF